MEVKELALALAEQYDISLAARPHRTGDDEELLIIVDQTTKAGNLRSYQKALRERGVNAIIRFSEIRSDNFTDALTESLRKRFGDDLIFANISSSPGAVNVSASYKHNDKFSSSDVRRHIEELAKLFSIENVVISVGEKATTPSVTEFLQMARISAPTSCELMQSLIVERGYPEPSLEWINHQFDLHRKKGFLLRREDRTYLLTHQGLAALGSGKTRFSPDVRRILELARGRK